MSSLRSQLDGILNSKSLKRIEKKSLLFKDNDSQEIGEKKIYFF